MFDGSINRLSPEVSTSSHSTSSSSEPEPKRQKTDSARNSQDKTILTLAPKTLLCEQLEPIYRCCRIHEGNRALEKGLKMTLGPLKYRMAKLQDLINRTTQEPDQKLVVQNFLEIQQSFKSILENDLKKGYSEAVDALHQDIRQSCSFRDRGVAINNLLQLFPQEEAETLMSLWEIETIKIGEHSYYMNRAVINSNDRIYFSRKIQSIGDLSVLGIENQYWEEVFDYMEGTLHPDSRTHKWSEDRAFFIAHCSNFLGWQKSLIEAVLSYFNRLFFSTSPQLHSYCPKRIHSMLKICNAAHNKGLKQKLYEERKFALEGVVYPKLFEREVTEIFSENLYSIQRLSNLSRLNEEKDPYIDQEGELLIEKEWVSKDFTGCLLNPSVLVDQLNYLPKIKKYGIRHLVANFRQKKPFIKEMALHLVMFESDKKHKLPKLNQNLSYFIGSFYLFNRVFLYHTSQKFNANELSQAFKVPVGCHSCLRSLQFQGSAEDAAVIMEVLTMHPIEDLDLKIVERQKFKSLDDKPLPSVIKLSYNNTDFLLLSKLFPNIQELHITFDELSEDPNHVSWLGLETLQNLEKLTISSGRIGSKIGTILLETIKPPRTLKSLYLSLSNFSNESIQPLLERGSKLTASSSELLIYVKKSKAEPGEWLLMIKNGAVEAIPKRAFKVLVLEPDEDEIENV